MPTVTIIQPTICEQAAYKLRVAAYCRVSSSSDDQLNSYSAQLNYYSHKFDDSATEELVDLYADEGITGTREDKRDEFLRMIHDCRKGKIDRIYTKSISRFARNTKECLKNVRELKSLGISVCFEKENIDTAKVTDEMMITILGGLAQEESVSISQNMRWSVEKRMQEGTYRLSRLPFGYQYEGTEIVLNEAESSIVKQIFDMYLSGIGFHAIAMHLNEHEVPVGKEGERWHKTTVRYIVTNPAYTGQMVYRKTYHTDSFPFTRRMNKGEKEYYAVQDKYPVIILQEDYEQAQRLLADAYTTTTRNHLVFSKKLLCDSCGKNLRRKTSNYIKYWVCQTHDRELEECDLKPISEISIQEAFIQLYNKLFTNSRILLLPISQSLTELRSKRYNGNSQVLEIHKEIAKLKEQVHVIARLRTKGFLDEKKCREQLAELERKTSKLQTEFKKISKSDEEDETINQIEMLIAHFQKRDEIMTEFEDEAFEEIVEKIIVKNTHELEFHLLGGLKFTEEI